MSKERDWGGIYRVAGIAGNKGRRHGQRDNNNSSLAPNNTQKPTTLKNTHTRNKRLSKKSTNSKLTDGRQATIHATTQGVSMSRGGARYTHRL